MMPPMPTMRQHDTSAEYAMMSRRHDALYCRRYEPSDTMPPFAPRRHLREPIYATPPLLFTRPR